MKQPRCTWSECWTELHRLRRDLHRLFERMRDISPGSVATDDNVRIASNMAIQFAADEIGISEQSIRSRSRTEKVAWARHIAIHAVRIITGARYSAIKRAFGLHDHNSVKYACRRVKEEPLQHYRKQAEHVLQLTRDAVSRALITAEKPPLHQTLKKMQ